MELVTKAIKGTQDFLPNDIHKIQYIERVALEAAEKFGFKEIRTPVFEHTELFNRGVGDTTDVVQKEMYTFNDKGGRSITLRPEGTASAARAYLENALFNEVQPQKVCYLASCYRYDKPQAGRYREFHQFGVECFGTPSPAADAEVIALAKSFVDTLGLKNISLEINSIGCPDCRKDYYAALHKYLADYKSELCPTCQSRIAKNPMRVLDCKSPICSKIASGAPHAIDYLCSDCKDHFASVQQYLNVMNITYTINPRIVRGLDYYTKTVFELTTNELGAQSAVCGGGRYDGLIEQLGGAKTPSLGFAIGLERILLLMQAQQCDFPTPQKPDLFIATMNKAAHLKAAQLAADMRDEGFTALYDLNDRSLRAQMKYADKLDCQFNITLGEDELKSGVAKLKNMQTGDVNEISLEKFVSSFYSISLDSQLSSIEIGDEAINFNTLFGLNDNEN